MATGLPHCKHSIIIGSIHPCEACEEEKLQEPLSDCCGAPIYEDTDICGSCKEHCEVMMKFHSVNSGHCQVNYTATNPLGEKVYYCIQENDSCGELTYIILRTCKNFEPSNIAHSRIPLDQIFELPVGDNPLAIRVRNFIGEK
jgi:hypothetical protein